MEKGDNLVVLSTLFLSSGRPLERHTLRNIRGKTLFLDKVHATIHSIADMKEVVTEV